MQGHVADAGRDTTDLVGVHQGVEFEKFSPGEGGGCRVDEEDDDGGDVVGVADVVVVEVLSVDGGEVVLPGEVVGLGEEDEEIEEGEECGAEGVGCVGAEREGLSFDGEGLGLFFVLFCGLGGTIGPLLVGLI